MVVKTYPKSKKPSRHDSISEFRITFDLNSMQVVFEAIASSFETIRWVVFIFHFWGAKILINLSKVFQSNDLKKVDL